LVGIVTPPDRPAGRRGAPTPVPVAAEARARGIPLLQPERVRAPEAAASIAGLRPDLGVLADFGRIVPPAVLAIPADGILNVHPSLLPRHRGATPIAATILEGDVEAGVTVMRMDEGLDTGPVVASRSWPLDGTETAPELEARAAVEGASLVSRIVDAYLRGEVDGAPQDDAAATLTRPLRREDGRLDPERSATHLERQVRAYLPWPGSWLETPAGRLGVLRAAVAPRDAGDTPGSLVPDGTGVALVAADGRLRLLDVQPAGGRPMPADAFRRGHPGILSAAAVAHG
ncbi:MAG TPA: methionyl-tRNA formyltransferase, partial [Candidatus Limnocylindrales bacterium]|nr:methionyl-tRNA formyltransferase [Candidatus Limnocylindrales bacterium]